MTTWIIDQGNTRLKLGVFLGDVLERVLFDDEALAHIANSQGNTNALPLHVLMASSGQLEDELSERVAKVAKHVHYLSPGLDVGLTLDYDTPLTLGWDRIANALSATALDADAVWAIVDAGTCITCDLVSSGTFFGGSISPGIDLRFKAMYAGTASLPLVDSWREQVQFRGNAAHSDWPEHVGTSTEGSLIAGAWGGVRAEIQARLSDFGKRWPDLKVIFTGGDAEYLHSQESESIFADSNLTLKGYYAILQRLI